MNRLFTRAALQSAMIACVSTGLIASAFLFLDGCRQPAETLASSSVVAPLVTNRMPTLTRSEVLAKFRERASAIEFQDFERLAATNDPGSQIRAMEMVLFKLTTDELFRIGITQTEHYGRFYWSLATSTSFADGGKAFENALKRVGVKASGVMELGLVGWYVPRDQFFAAQHALLNASLPTNEIRIIQQQFNL